MDRHTEFKLDDDGNRAPHRSCNVVNQGCKAPPVIADSFTKATCFACGLPVCTGPQCSRRIRWHKYGQRRICHGCESEERRTRADSLTITDDIHLSNKNCPNYYGTMRRGSFRGSKGCDCPDGRCWYNEQRVRRREGKLALAPDWWSEQIRLVNRKHELSLIDKLSGPQRYELRKINEKLDAAEAAGAGV